MLHLRAMRFRALLHERACRTRVDDANAARSFSRTHHVHLCESGSEQERVHLVFRDHLRNHSTVAAEYLELKLSLSAVHDGLTTESQERYSLAKSEFIRSVLREAQKSNLTLHRAKEAHESIGTDDRSDRLSPRVRGS